MTDTKRPPSRERLLDAAVDLLRTKGPSASGTKEILERAGAPRGSFYFHFPDGKDQLVAEAVARAAAVTEASIVAALADRSVALPERIEAFVRDIGTGVAADDYLLGCAVGATSLETAAISPPLREAAATAFASWTAVLVATMEDEGIAPGQAVMLADSVVAGMEGATMLARVRRDPSPLASVATTLRTAVAASLPA